MRNRDETSVRKFILKKKKSNCQWAKFVRIDHIYIYIRQGCAINKYPPKENLYAFI